MPISSAAGYTNFSSDGLMKATQKIYSKKTLVKFYANAIYNEIANTEYESEGKQTDEVIIRVIPDSIVRPYVKDADLVYDSPESTAISLKLDKANYIATRIDKIDEKLTDINWISKWAEDGAEQMKIAVDREILNGLYAYAASGNTGATAGVLSAAFAMGTQAAPITVTTNSSATDAINLILDAEAVISEQNVPEDDQRFLVAPTWFINKLQKGDLRRADSMGAPANQDILRNGKIGKLGQFNVFRTNNIAKDSVASGYPIIFGHKSALTFCAQMRETETLPHPTKFGTIMRTMFAYGWKVIKPESLGIIWVKPA